MTINTPDAVTTQSSSNKVLILNIKHFGTFSDHQRCNIKGTLFLLNKDDWDLLLSRDCWTADLGSCCFFWCSPRHSHSPGARVRALQQNRKQHKGCLSITGSCTCKTALKTIETPNHPSTLPHLLKAIHSNSKSLWASPKIILLKIVVNDKAHTLKKCKLN